MNDFIPPREFRIAHPDGHHLNVREWGEKGPACMLIHGSGDGGYLWEDVALCLRPYYRVIAVDLRGHGDSGWDRRGKYSIESYVSDVLYGMRVLRLGSVALVGHSLGADIATRIAAADPERITALVLIDFAPSLNRGAMEHARAKFNSLFRVYKTRSEYESLLRVERPLVKPELIRRIATYALRSEEDGCFTLKCDPAVSGTSQGPEEAALWKMIESVTCPSLIVRGSGSAVLSRQAALRMVRAMRNSRLVEVGAAGHGVVADNPSESAAALLAFLPVASRVVPRSQ